MPKRPTKILNQLLDKKAKGEKMFAVLIDPDKANEAHLAAVLASCINNKVDFLFIGGSMATTQNAKFVVSYCKANTNIPLILFPGSYLGVNEEADALLFLALTSGRNAEYLIGQHVAAAPLLKDSKLEIIPTSYLLIDGGKPTTVSYISGTTPIPNDKPEIAAATALAGEMLGHKLIFVDCGSGANQTVSNEMLVAISKWVDLPILCGGGIDSAQKAQLLWQSGADVLVVGNAIEKTVSLIAEIASVKF
ncbi:MAG: geranylgeranylglyceryl/heptaprenylglyceryl phosphate synthase [Cytophagales bacterium]